ncbi:4'-phosphopantetheinyl transferase [Marinobacter sp.]|uniref:4'-phosphopantetheinyl transferase family protein n=1 Tax=Marinobacter sp. TaxID=50741 RepID=UPI001B5806F1|nr:4'-phosphopantetheinyl transferase superfamily protein [Marinobacter sp.]MBQ0833829.1 4'-phosphopantetheinyl transferase superfamily protein [Marinobacter sp.]
MEQCEILAIFESLVPSHVACALASISHGSTSPYAAENMAMRKAVAKRRCEFFAGRKAARQALGKLGIEPLSIPMGVQRDPLWPNGIVGAITHTQYHAVAIVASANHFKGVGLDLEKNGRISEALATEIEAEAGDLNSDTKDRLTSQGICAHTLRYSAKESGFKAYFPAYKHFLAYRDVSCTVDLTTNSFTLRADEALETQIHEHRLVKGMFSCTGPYLATFAWC